MAKQPRQINWFSIAMRLTVGLVILFAAMVAFVMRFSIRNVQISDCVAVQGTVERIWEGSSYDVCFRLRNDPRTYYINRGLEQGLQLQQLKAELVGQPIDLWYVDLWTPMDPNSMSRHVSRVTRSDGEIVFDEIEEESS